MYQIYNLIGRNSFTAEDGLLINDIDHLLDTMNDERFVGCLELFCKEKPKFKSPADALLIFIRAVKKANLFDFVQFMDGFK